MTGRRRRVVLLGMMAKMPVPGVVWQTMHYLLGLERLGFEPYYVEAHGRTPSMLMEEQDDDGSQRAAHLIAELMRRFDLGDRWAYQALHEDGRCFGLGEGRLRQLYREAELIINLHGGTVPRPEMQESRQLLYLETDPVQLQVELHDGVQESFDFLAAHTAFFTFAENLGRPECGLPVCDRFVFRHTRQPVVLDLWAGRTGSDPGRFTTIGNWRQPWRTVRLGGDSYGWSKDEQWLKFLDLPRLTGSEFELALSGCRPKDRELLERHGWRVREALRFGTDTDAYRDFIVGSRGEFTVAKDQNIRLRTGWFSDRAATYLAAGRPVITQDTGFGKVLPTGEGLFAVSTVEQASTAVEMINADYDRHSRAAFEIAREYFDAERVLAELVREVDVSTNGRNRERGGSPAGMKEVGVSTNGGNPNGASAPAVSVVIPCFDLGDYVIEAVESVLAQTRPPDELIVVDDGSTDEATLGALNELRRRGVLVYRTPNRGAPSARNFGIERSSGDYILCLDADDVLLPRFLERTVALMEVSPDAGIVATQVEFFGERSGTWHPPAYSFPTLLWSNCLPSASLFRRRCWLEAGGFAAELEACQDWDLWLSIVERGWRWKVVDEPLYRYRGRSGSISDHRERNRERVLTAMMSRHPSAYADHAIEAIIELDGKLKETGAHLDRFRRDNAKQGERIRALQEALRPPADEQVEPFRALVAGRVPDGATVLVVSKGDEDLLALGDRRAWHFPRRPDGGWPGYHPKTDAEAIEQLEELRSAGAEFLCFPRKERWWLKRYDVLRRYLEQTYPVVARTDDGVIFDVRQEVARRSLSVVICTYRRPELVAQAMRSVFEQRYPKDRYELIVVNNASPDETEEVVLEAARECPVRFTYLVEEHNGLSHCRNRGIRVARHEYVAQLDDDATAFPDWLATFNAVIDEHHALVVGGRIEKAFEEGYKPPPWFEAQYVKHFFGVNYRDRGRKEHVFRIRHPLYVGGGNIAYARRLFEHFGGFDTRLGRDGKTLLAGEEAYLNMVLDRHDIPIYYTDDAWIDHHIDSRRLTKRHLRRKAYWSGVTNAVMHPMFFGFPEVRAKTEQNRKEIFRRLRELREERGSPENFMRELRLIYNASFLFKFYARYLGYRLGRHREQPQPTTWGPEQWLAEVRGWRDSREKFERLRALGRETGDAALVEEAERRLGSGQLGSAGPSGASPRRWSRAEYEELVPRVRAEIAAHVPVGARVALASKGDDRLIDVPGRRGCHFPQLDDGTYAGYYPADDTAAIAAVERLREAGVAYLVFPATALWWRGAYPLLARHLASSHERVHERPETCAIYRLVKNAQPAQPESVSGNGTAKAAASEGVAR